MRDSPRHAALPLEDATGTKLVLVPTVRLELTRLSPPPPQDGVSTNSTTSARCKTGAILLDSIAHRGDARYPISAGTRARHGVLLRNVGGLRCCRRRGASAGAGVAAGAGAGAGDRPLRRCRHRNVPRRGVGRGRHRSHDPTFVRRSLDRGSYVGERERRDEEHRGDRRRCCATGNWRNRWPRTGCRRRRLRMLRPCRRLCRAGAARAR